MNKHIIEAIELSESKIHKLSERLRELVFSDNQDALIDECDELVESFKMYISLLDNAVTDLLINTKQKELSFK